jgi:hypothetical protein
MPCIRPIRQPEEESATFTQDKIIAESAGGTVKTIIVSSSWYPLFFPSAPKKEVYEFCFSTYKELNDYLAKRNEHFKRGYSGIGASYKPIVYFAEGALNTIFEIPRDIFQKITGFDFRLIIWLLIAGGGLFFYMKLKGGKK